MGGNDEDKDTLKVIENIDKRLIRRDFDAICEDVIAKFRIDLQAEYETIKSEIREELKIGVPG